MKLITDNGIEIELEKIQTITAQKDEVLVLTLKEPIPHAAIKSIMYNLEKAFPDNKVLITESGMQFQLVKEP